MNIGTFLFELFYKMGSAGTVLYNFIMQEITLGDYTVSLWGLVGGVGLVAILILGLVKSIV